jgi:hypothetical protein
MIRKKDVVATQKSKYEKVINRKKIDEVKDYLIM